MAQQLRAPSTEQVMSMLNASGLKKKILFTFLMIAVWRFGVQMPLYGINNQIFANIASGNNIIGFLDLFTGGALGKVSILALGIGPFITSSIIIQLVSVVIPALEKLQKEEGEEGRRKLSQYTRLFTVVLAIFQGFIFMLFLHHLPGAIMPGVSSTAFYINSICILTAGAVLVMWISELITENGIGNGGSLIIFCGILSGIPVYASRTYQLVKSSPQMQMGLLILLTIFFLATILIVIMQEAVRKVIIVNPKRQIGNKVYGGMNSFIPFKLNPGGVMPIIFAQALMMFPLLFAQFDATRGFAATFSDVKGFWYNAVFAFLIIVFTYFYTTVIINPTQMAEEMKKNGGFIPGVKPGKNTAEYIDSIMSRITLPGSIFLAIVGILPALAMIVGVNNQFAQFYGGTSLLIMVGVVLDTLQQIESHLLMRHYDGLTKTGRLKGR